MMNKKELEKLIKQGAKKAELVKLLEDKIKKSVHKKERILFSIIKTKVLDKLEVDEKGLIKKTKLNFSRISNIDLAFNQFVKEQGKTLAKEVVSGVNDIIHSNSTYYSLMSNNPVKILATQRKVKQYMYAWLGITNKGALEKNGYLDKIVNSDAIRLNIQTMVSSSLIGKRGWKDTMLDIENEIVSRQEKKGALDKYYRNFVYDTFATSDRMVSETYRSDLNLEFAIYEGGVIKTTRKFCKENNGRVFHYTEIEKFNPEGEFPAYNPFLHLGKWGCRHYLNWIPNEYAFTLREDAKNFLENIKK